MKIALAVAKVAMRSNSSSKGRRGSLRVVIESVVWDRALDPSGIVGGVKTGIDGQGLSGAPACERLGGGRVAAGGEERACEAHSKTVEAVNSGLVLWEKSSEQEAEEAVELFHWRSAL